MIRIEEGDYGYYLCTIQIDLETFGEISLTVIYQTESGMIGIYEGKYRYYLCNVLISD